MKKLWTLFLALVFAVGIVSPALTTDVYAAAGALLNVNGTDYTDYDAGWSAAIELAEEGIQTTVILKADWNAENGEFDYEEGTDDGRLYLNDSAIDMTIDLNGYTINRGLTTACSNGQVFEINDGKLTIKDSVGTGKITGGNNTGNGGAFYVDYGSLYIKGGEISGNNALQGGGIYGDDQDDVFIYIEGGKICNNTATEGAGIYVYEGYLTIRDGEISGNQAEKNGGGIYWYSDNEMLISGGKISGNSAICGGGIYLKNNMVMKDGLISDNSASWGGGIYGEVGDAYLLGGKISGNRANYGGAILWYRDYDLYLENTITGNSAKEFGGGVYVYSELIDVFVGGSVVVSGNGSKLGADNILLAYESNDLINGYKCDFSAAVNLTTGANIGVRCLYDDPQGEPISADDCGFDAECGQYFSSDIPGYILMLLPDPADSDHPYKLTMCAKKSNTPLVEVSTDSITNTFYDFDAAWSNAVTASAATPTTVKLLADWNAENGEFNYTEGTNNGYLYLNKSNIDLTIDLNGHKIDRNLNSETANGQVFYIAGGAKLTITDSSSAGNGKITGGNNTEDGGAFYIDYGKLYINGGEISGNSAANGGAVYATNEDDSFVYVNGGKISGNTATNGGAFYMFNGYLYVDGGEISGNSATKGGGIYWESRDVCSLTGGTIKENSAANGGGVYAENWGDIYLGGKIVVNNNTSISGSANNLYLEDTSTYLNNAAGQNEVPNKPLTEGAYVGIYSDNVNFCISDLNSRFTENSVKYLHSDLANRVIRSLYNSGYGNHSYQLFYSSSADENIPSVKLVQAANMYVRSASPDKNSKTIKLIVDAEFKKQNHFNNNIVLSELIKVTFNKEGTELVGFNEVRNFSEDQEYKIMGPDGSYAFWTVTIEWLCSQHEDNNGDYICENCREYILTKFAIADYNARTKEATVLVPESGRYALIFAAYENGCLENVEVVEYEFEEGVNVIMQRSSGFTLEKSDKVMLWNDKIRCIPLCDALTLE